MDVWEIIRSIAALGALVVSLIALFLARNDRGTERQMAGLNRVETSVTTRLSADKELADERHNSISTRLGQIESRLSGVDEAFKHAPNATHLNAIQVQVGEVAQTVGRLGGILDANTRMVERMNDHLMNRGT